jgi:hypothetical protein
VIVFVVALAGVMAGAIHVLAGADHLAAVVPLAVADRRPAWRAGLRWGLGHAGGVTIVALLAFGLREVVPLETLTSWSERMVGVTLIAIGAWALTGARRTPRQRDGARPHAPVHTHGRQRAAIFVGLLHGTAGGSHILGVIPVLALPTRAAALGYLTGFGAGTVVAMALFASVVGAVSARFALAGPRAWAGFLRGCGATSIAVGVFWLAP